MDEKLTELNTYGEELAALFDELERLAFAERAGEDVAELWLRARFRCAIAFDEHVRMLREVAEGRPRGSATPFDSPAEPPQGTDAHPSTTDRQSTFTKVHNGEEVAALASIKRARAKGSSATNRKENDR